MTFATGRSRFEELWHSQSARSGHRRSHDQGDLVAQFGDSDTAQLYQAMAKALDRRDGDLRRLDRKSGT